MSRDDSTSQRRKKGFDPLIRSDMLGMAPKNDGMSRYKTKVIRIRMGYNGVWDVTGCFLLTIGVVPANGQIWEPKGVFCAFFSTSFMQTHVRDHAKDMKTLRTLEPYSTNEANESIGIIPRWRIPKKINRFEIYSTSENSLVVREIQPVFNTY